MYFASMCGFPQASKTFRVSGSPRTERISLFFNTLSASRCILASSFVKIGACTASLAILSCSSPIFVKWVPSVFINSWMNNRACGSWPNSCIAAFGSSWSRLNNTWLLGSERPFASTGFSSNSLTKLSFAHSPEPSWFNMASWTSGISRLFVPFLFSFPPTCDDGCLPPIIGIQNNSYFSGSNFLYSCRNSFSSFFPLSLFKPSSKQLALSGS
mmetsp:Transcript_15287/g.24855  ORF Transcript_15287/g.24855 Transcript_15287/m.24855 type:complete len:213 (-) Transcript_15287:584-1222(-)